MHHGTIDTRRSSPAQRVVDMNAAGGCRWGWLVDRGGDCAPGRRGRAVFAGLFSSALRLQLRRVRRGGVWLAAFALVCACGDEGDDSTVEMDASARDGMTIVDGTFELDVAIRDSSPGGDSALFDLGPPPMCSGPCAPDDPDSCGANNYCVLSSDTPACTDSVGSAQAGTPCEMSDQCALGHACFRRRTGGACAPVCCPSRPDSCGAGLRCRGSGQLADGTPTSFGECVQPASCDVLASDACEPGEACYIVADELEGTGCLRAGDGEAGASCEAPSDCAPGFSCVGAFEQTCRRVCRLGMTEGCPTAEGACQAYAQSPEGTGLCTPEASAG